eukprot:5207928-Prymnesium_polylepis.1
MTRRSLTTSWWASRFCRCCRRHNLRQLQMSRRDMPVMRVRPAWRSGTQTLKGRECMMRAAGRGARFGRVFDGRAMHLQLSDELMTPAVD